MEAYFNSLKFQKTINHRKLTDKKLAEKTIINIKNIVSSIFRYAVNSEFILRNPCDGIKLRFDNYYENIEDIRKIVKKEREKVHYLTLKDYKKVCKELERNFIEIYNNFNIEKQDKIEGCARILVILLALKTGMRRGEIFGLARNNGFNDLDLKAQTFDVNKSRGGNKGDRITTLPKNRKSIRIKYLPTSLIEYIEKYYSLLDNSDYKDGYIFDCISIDGITKFWKKWQIKNKIFPIISFHDLRHTHATILLFKGVDMKTISERLGHSSIKTTFNIYADVMKELDQKSIKKIEDL